MRSVRSWFVLALALVVLVLLRSPSGAVSLPDIDAKAQAYANSLRAKYGGRARGPAALLKRVDEALEKEQWSDAVRLLEELAGRALGGHQIPGKTAADLLHALGEAWSKHPGAGDEGLWAAYIAQKTPPRDRGPGNLASLVVIGQILLNQINALHDSFDYRGATLDKIADRLKTLEYGPARIATEDAQRRLPADVRELLDLKAREERERILLIEKITGRMGLANLIYQEIAKTSAHVELSNDIKKAVSKQLFYVKNVYADARRSAAAICLEFNLPLRSDAGEYRDMVKVFPLGTDGKAVVGALVTEWTVREQTLCLHGLRHGHRYHVLVRKGLPSKSGAVLSQDYDSRIPKQATTGDEENQTTYLDAKSGLAIPNRRSSVGFRSTAFILPKFGGGSVPLMTVNLDRVDLELLRLSDRTLHRQIALGQIASAIGRTEFTRLRTHFSDVYWRGGVDLPDQPNDTITTNLPIRELLNDRASVLATLKDRAMEWPFLSEPITTGPLRGQFRIDKLSVGAPESLPEEPGIYALFANAKKRSSGGDSQLEDTDAEWEDANASAKSREVGNDDDSLGYCKDDDTGRKSSCRVSVQWFVVTDIGLSYFMGPEELYVIARSLSTGKPLRDANIQLLAANNRVLDEGKTDSAGIATFKSRFTRGTDGNRLAAVTAFDGGDFSFVTFSRDVFDLSDHGTAGRRPPRFFDAYIYPDRGVYRPEETIHTTLLVRDPEGNAAQRIPPVTVKLKASNGKIIEEKRVASTAWQLGGTAVDLVIPSSAPLGQADILVYLGEGKEPIGRTTVQLDHFRPDRARISLVRDGDWRVTASPDQTVTVNGFADAQYLFGLRTEGSLKTDAPAANLTGEVTMLIQAAPSPFKGCYADYQFGRIENEFTPLLHRAPLSSRTDAKGELALETTAKLPPGEQPLQAIFTLTLFDEGGKVGQQSRMIHIPVDRLWLGIRHEARLLPTKEGLFQLNLDMVALDFRNEPRSTRLKYRVWRERNVFIWHQNSNSWRYQPDVQRTLVKEESIVATPGNTSDGACKAANAAAQLDLPLGRYYIEVEDEAGPRVTFRRDAGWSGAGLHAPTPDRLTIHADARKEGDIASYRPGDVATFSIDAPFDGEVLLAIANDRVHLWDSTVSTVNRQATIKLRIDPQWAGGSFYALATVYRRNTDGSVKNGPSRAMGAIYFAVDREAQRLLKVDIKISDQVSSERPLALTLHSEGLQGRAWATVYAVDEGLLSLSNHPPPDAFAHFFGQRALGLEVLDNYGRILLAEKANRDRSGGDRSRRLMLANYTSDRIVADFTGPVEFVDGVAHVQFDKLSDFSGTIRIAAVVWTDRKVGGASHSVVQRQRVLADAKMPRFLTPGDRVTIPLKLRVTDGMHGRYRVSLVPKAPLKLEGVTVADRRSGKIVAPGVIELDVSDEGRALDVALSLPLGVKATNVEMAIHVDGVADLANERRITRAFNIAVRPVEAPATDVAFITLLPGETANLTPALISDLMRERFVEKNLGVRIYASTDPLGVVRWLTPESWSPQVGVLERIVWRGMILLRRTGPETRTELAGIVHQIEALQASDGYYVGYRLVTETGLNESRDIFDRSTEPVTEFERREIWRTALALDFLLQVRQMGMQVDDAGRQAAVSALRDKLRRVLENDDSDDSPPATNDSDAATEPVAEVSKRLVEDKDSLVEAQRRGRSPQTSARRNLRNPDLMAKLLNGNDYGGKRERDDDNESTDNRDDTSAPYYRKFNACDEDILYAAFVLVQSDAIDRFDLSTLMNRCGTAMRPIRGAMLAAALNKFGLTEDARGVLASIEARGGALGDDAAGEETRFDSMMLAFLALADAGPGLRSELAQRLAKQDSPPLSLASRAWLARAYAEPALKHDATRKALRVDVAGRLRVETQNDSELVTESVPVAEFATRGVTLRNAGAEPVTVALVLHGTPRDAAASPEGGLKITRRVITQRGEDVDLQRAKLKPNDLLYIILSGERERENDTGEAERLQDPLVIVDRLPAGFEIVDRDVFELARSDSVALRAVLPSDGKQGRLRVAEARDDQLLAIVKPTSSGNFQIGYSVRVVAVGRFVNPGTIVEDLYRSDIASHAPDSIVQVEGHVRN